MSSLVFFQFVFAAITVIILGGALLGRISFKAWALFVPLWITLVYSVGAFSLWGGGWLSALGAVDYSGGYVIHVAAAASGFVAAAVVGPRLLKDRNASPSNIMLAVAGGGLLWLGWSGFNGGDPYFANADASAAVLNTHLCTATALSSGCSWTCSSPSGRASSGMINGMIAGLVGDHPGRRLRQRLFGADHRGRRRRAAVAEHELAGEDAAVHPGRRHPRRLPHARCRGSERGPADRRAGLPEHDRVHRHRHHSVGRR